jgi:hypothetical protein
MFVLALPECRRESMLAAAEGGLAGLAAAEERCPSLLQMCLVVCSLCLVVCWLESWWTTLFVPIDSPLVTFSPAQHLDEVRRSAGQGFL